VLAKLRTARYLQARITDELLKALFKDSDIDLGEVLAPV